MWKKMQARRAATQAMKIATEARSEDRMGRTEQLGHGLRVRDEMLWSPLEVVAFPVLIVLVFGFVLGGGNYGYVAEMFLPVIVIGVAVMVFQTLQRWRAGNLGLAGQPPEISGEGQDQPYGDQQRS